MKKQMATQRRNQRIGLISAIVGAVAVLALVIGFIVVGSTPKPSPDDIEIEGLQNFGTTLAGVHVGPEPVDYEEKYDMNPPAGGDHYAAWLNCGIYTEPQVNENAVHSLEHGAVWVTYDPDEVDAAGVEALRSALPGTYSILSPYPGLPSPVVVSAWNAQVELDGPDDDRLEPFIQKFWKSAAAPEPGASCSGAIDGPGRVS